MSFRHGSSHRDRERDRRRSPSPRRRHGSPGSSRRERRASPKREGCLPQSFDRESRESKDDQRNVLERMEKACDSQPMRLFLKCIKERTKVKVWTRNYKEVRGICTGYIEYFDKHWNLVMRDVKEIFLRPKKGKTPYLDMINDPDTVPEAKPKVPKEKKKPAEGDAAPPPPPQIKVELDPESAEKKKRRRKKKKNKMDNREVSHLFLRGDNIVMVAVCPFEVVEEEEEEEAEPEVVEIKMEA